MRRKIRPASASSECGQQSLGLAANVASHAGSPRDMIKMADSTTMTTYRFPTGECEYRLGATVPQIGEVMQRNDETWYVAHVETTRDGSMIVTLRPKAT